MTEETKLEATSLPQCFTLSLRKTDNTDNSDKVTATHLEVTDLGNSSICRRMHLM